jgi:glucose/arabinose dehydrogenase
MGVVPLLAACAASPASADGLAADAAKSFKLIDHVTGLGQTTDVAFLPDGRMVIAEKEGALKIRSANGKVTVAGTFAVDDNSEKGLLGVIPHPAFASNRLLILYYSAAQGTSRDKHRVVTVPLRADGTLDRAAEKVLVQGLRGPANHDGGALAIGPDGKLYVGVGDTGCNSGHLPSPQSPPSNYFGTCLTNGNGKILRVELDGAIPADNPLVGATPVTACGDGCRDVPSATGAARTDIWAWGFRNPWRFWFDPKTGNLWVGDVGEVDYEEVNVIPPKPAARHYGWPWREGSSGFPREKCRETAPDTGACVDPVYLCSHRGGRDGDCHSITAGAIVDSCHWPDAFRGRYFFADNVHGRIWSVGVNAARNGVVAGSRRDFGRISDGIPVSIRLGPDGDLYLAVLPGKVVRIAPKVARPCP